MHKRRTECRAGHQKVAERQKERCEQDVDQSINLAGRSRIRRLCTRSSKETHKRNRIEMVHARFNDLAVLQPVDADGRQVDAVSVRAPGAKAPQHDDAIAGGKELWFELTSVLGLVAIPGRSKSFGVP